MNTITFFTTFNDVGYHLYGRAWIKTFIKIAEKNKNIQAKIYYENFAPELWHDSIEYIDFHTALPHHANWKQQYLLTTKHGNYTKKQVVRFSHKAFVTQHALETIDTDYAIWLDGDCVFKDEEYYDFPSDVLAGKLLACQVEQHAYTTIKHVESGILIFEVAHKDKDQFVKTLSELYKLENIISMPNDCVDYNPSGQWEDYGPYDGFIVHKTLMTSKIPFVNLNESYFSGEFTGTPEKTFTHPAIANKFVHNIGWDGKNNYTQVNRELDIDAKFEWNTDDTARMVYAEIPLEDQIEVTGKFDNQEFAFTVHNPTKDRFVSAEIFYNGHWEPRISKLIVDAMRPGGIFVDIGANIGWHSKVVQMAGHDVIAFEPEPANYEVLKKNCDQVSTVLYNLALGDQATSLLIERDPINYGNSFISDHGTTEINVVRLDDLLDDAIIAKVSAVKIDVQGFETKVIEGAKNFFDRLLPGTLIIIEVSPTKSTCDLKVIGSLVAKCTKSYALSFWTDNEITVDQALATCRRPERYNVPARFLNQTPPVPFEFDLILIK